MAQYVTLQYALPQIKSHLREIAAAEKKLAESRNTEAELRQEVQYEADRAKRAQAKILITMLHYIRLYFTRGAVRGRLREAGAGEDTNAMLHCTILQHKCED